MKAKHAVTPSNRAGGANPVLECLPANKGGADLSGDKPPEPKQQPHRSISDVVANRVCCGCGACTVACSVSAIRFVYGARFNFPEVDGNLCNNCGKCRKVCPSLFLMHGSNPGFPADPPPPLECLLAHHVDDSLRWDAASGGFITGLALHLLETKEVDGVVVARCEGANPLVAESFIAHDRASLLSARGSKYAPVSSCTVLGDIMEQPGRYAFVGTPCMIEGLVRLQELFPKLRERVVLTIGFVCAGMASRLSTRNYLEQDGKVNASEARRIVYRGGGWPGRFRVFGKADKLLMDRPLIGGSLRHVVGVDHYLRCENCLDHWSRFADLVVSDPWSADHLERETKGESAVLIRSARGQARVAAAVAAGALWAKPIPTEDMIGFNRHLWLRPEHERFSWMALYQLLFHKRLRFLPEIARRFFLAKLVGLRTTLRARFIKKYYY